MSQTAPRHDDREHTLTPPPSFGAAQPNTPSNQQAEAVAEWLRWHAVELAGVGVPIALAVVVWSWLAVLALPAAGVWAAHEARQRARLRAAAERPALTTPNTTSTNTEGVE